MIIRTAAALGAMAVLILDSRWAAESVRDALQLCLGTLIPCLFPLFVLSAMAVGGLQSIRIPFLAKLLRFPPGSEGIFLLGAIGGFPVGAAAAVQSVRSGALSKQDAKRMIGLCSCCGPAFLFGVVPHFLSMDRVIVLFILQLETATILGAFWPGGSSVPLESVSESVSLPDAVLRSVRSMVSVCAWVTVAAVAAGFLRRWLFPLLPNPLTLLLTGLLELTNGIFALEPGTDLTFLLCSIFVCFGGISVLLQIGGLASSAGIPMKCCIAQKSIHALLGAAAAGAYLRFGTIVLLVIPAILLLSGKGRLFSKIPVAFHGSMVYNTGRKEGIEDAVS